MDTQPIHAPFDITPTIRTGTPNPLLIAGPCVVESREITRHIAFRLKEIAGRFGIPLIFKASFDKANRSSIESFRSLGMKESLQILAEIRSEFNIPILTDVHETTQVELVAEVVDVLQIPAFLCRQTDLLLACGKTGKTVNIKKGQFLAPEDMWHAVEKVRTTGNPKILLTERGTTFGYHNLVVDMRALPVMRRFAPVIFDMTHSVQRPGGLGNRSGGNREMIPFLARAAAAVGVDGFFMETHPCPDNSPSDGPNMIPLDALHDLLKSLLQIWKVSRPFHSVSNSPVSDPLR